MITAASSYSGLSSAELLQLFTSSSATLSPNNNATLSTTTSASALSVGSSSTTLQAILTEVQIGKASSMSAAQDVASNSAASKTTSYDSSTGISLVNVTSGTETADYFKLDVSLNGSSTDLTMEANGAGVPQFSPNGQEVNVGTGGYQELFLIEADSGKSSVQQRLDVTGLTQAQAKEMYSDFLGSARGASSEADISTWNPKSS